MHLASFSDVAAPAWESTTLFTTERIDSLNLGQGTIPHAVFASDQGLMVSNNSEIVVLRPDGTPSRPLGRRGAGPGEFQNVFTLGALEDGSLFVSEYGSGRLSRFTPSGEVLHIVTHLSDYAHREPEPIAVLADGRVLMIPWQWRPNRRGDPAAAGGPFDRDPVLLLVVDTTGAIVDTLGRWPGLERVRGLPVRFARSVVYDGRGDATVLGVSDSLDLSVFQGTRLKLRLIAPQEVHTPTRRQRAEWDTAVVRTNAEDAGGALVAFENTTPDVPSLPGIGGVVLDEAGNIWVGAYVLAGEPTRRWRIFNPNGNAIGTISLPASNDPFMPSRTELMDVRGDRIVLFRENEHGDWVFEVRSVLRKK